MKYEEGVVEPRRIRLTSSTQSLFRRMAIRQRVDKIATEEQVTDVTVMAVDKARSNGIA